MRTFPLVWLSLALTGSIGAADEKIDYTQRLDGASAVPVYPVAYAVPSAEAVASSLGRIKGYVESHTSLRVFDNATGEEITDPAKLTAGAVLDGRLGPLNRWDYTNGVIVAGFLRAGEATGDTSYADYGVRFYDFIFTWMPAFREREERTGKRSEFSKMVHMAALDHCGAITAALIRTQLRHPDPRFREWIDVVDTYISTKQFRLEDGTLARQRPQPRALWTDDFYMSVPFLAQMGRLTGDTKYWDDAVRQVRQLSARLFVPEKGLYAHGWSENAHPYSPRFHWGRANGWAIMAMAELLEVLPADYPHRDDVLQLYRAQMRALIELQDSTGLWHNLLDKSDTYLETSASAMFVFGLAKGVNAGWLPASFAPAAIIGWNGVAAKILPDGRVAGICEGTTYANDASYYFHRGASADTTFFGAVFFAGAEMIRLVRNPALAIAAPEAGAANSALHVRRAEDLRGVKQ
ncbi:MAG: glycoside hydrolase family 88 protein [Opitutaceae bacterium]